MLEAASRCARDHTPALTTAAAADECVRSTGFKVDCQRSCWYVHADKHACHSQLESTQVNFESLALDSLGILLLPAGLIKSLDAEHKPPAAHVWGSCPVRQ